VQLIECPILYEHVPIVIGEHAFLVNLIQFDMLEFDLILGLEWLTGHKESIGGKGRKVTLKDQKSQDVYFYDERNRKSIP